MLLSEVKSLTLNLPTLLKEVIETTYNPHFSLVFLGLALAMMYQVEAKKMKDKKLFSQTSWVKHSYPLFPLPSLPSPHMDSKTVLSTHSLPSSP